MQMLFHFEIDGYETKTFPIEELQNKIVKNKILSECKLKKITLQLSNIAYYDAQEQNRFFFEFSNNTTTNAHLQICIIKKNCQIC